MVDDLSWDVEPLSIDYELSKYGWSIVRELQDSAGLIDASETKENASLDEITVVSIPSVSH